MRTYSISETSMHRTNHYRSQIKLKNAVEKRGYKPACRVSLFLLSALFAATLPAATMQVTEGVYTPFSTETINRQVNEIAQEVNDEPIVQLAGNQQKMAKAMGASMGTLLLQGGFYTGLDAGIVATGFSTGVAVDNIAGLAKIPDSFREGEDSGTGASTGGFVGTVTVNGDKLPFLKIKGLLITMMGGGTSVNKDKESDFSLDSFIIGMGLRYKVYDIPLTTPLAKMRAVTVGTGVYYMRNNVYYNPDDFEKKSDVSNGYQTTALTTVQFKIESAGTTIPLDVVTSAKVFGFLNFIAGMGCDLTFITTDISVSSNTVINAYDEEGTQIKSENPARMDLKDSDSSANAPLARFKTIFGIGFSFGPVHIEMPVAVYPTSGYTVALLVGATL